MTRLMRIDNLLSRSAAKIQAQTDSDSARIDAELLLLNVLCKPRSYLYAHPENKLTAEQTARYALLLERRLGGEPVAYILGKKEFWSLDFEVNSSVLIPRPDTECLVEFILNLNLGEDSAVIDLGVGSGAIAIALAHEKAHWRVYGVEYSAPALHLAQKNARRLLSSDKLCPPLFLQGNWLHCFAANSFELVVSNPPYIDGNDEHLKRGDVRFEPRTALVSNDRGMADIESIATQARQCLKPDGWLVLEHGFNQAGSVSDLLLSLEYREVKSFCDYAGNQRFSVGRV